MSLFILGILMGIISICVARTNWSSVFSLFIMCYLVLLAFNATEIVDYSQYISLYRLTAIDEQLAQSIASSGWVFLTKLALNFNLTFQYFKTIIYVICLILLFEIVKKITGRSYSLFWGLYLIYPALVDIVQIRFFLAMIICLIGLFFLKKGNFISIILFLVFLFLGTTIHNTVIFYLLFLLVPIIRKNKRRAVESIFLIDILLLIFNNSLKSFALSFSTDKQMQYFNTNISGWALIVLIILFSLIAYLSNAISSTLNSCSFVSSSDKLNSEFLASCNICMLLIIPFLPLAFNFFRLERISWIILYILLVLMNKYNLKFKLQKLELSLSYVGIIMVILGFVIMLLHFEPIVFWSYNFI